MVEKAGEAAAAWLAGRVDTSRDAGLATRRSTMPVYNIELRNAERVWETLRLERDDVTGLRIEMARFVGELLKDHAGQIWIDGEWRVDATDENGLILYILHLFATDSPASRAPQR